MAEMITLKRSDLGRATGSKISGEFLLEMGKYEQPNNTKYIMTNKGDEFMIIEKQFWLKFKKEFQSLGFLPVDRINEIKKIPYMLEKY